MASARTIRTSVASHAHRQRHGPELDGRSELHDKSLAALTAVLPPDFVRCHRSCLVNLRHVRSLHAGSGSRYWLVMANGKELPVGRAHVSGLRRELGIE